MVTAAIGANACQYLFGKSSKEIFPNYSEEFVNQSLDTIMRTNICFLSKQEGDAFPIIDPAAFNNQCHLYAMMAAKIKETFKQNSNEEKLAYTDQNRFLHLSFILSYTFINERNLICKLVDKAEKDGMLAQPKQKKLFQLFVKDCEGVMVKTARKALNEVFEKTFKEEFFAKKDLSPLNHEIYSLSQEDLFLLPDSWNAHKKDIAPLYTIPKLASVAYMINEKMPIIIKSIVVTKEGVEKLTYQSRDMNEDESVLVVEALTSDYLSVNEFVKQASQCSSYFFRNASSKHRHAATEECLFCRKEIANIEKLKPLFDKAVQNLFRTFCALGADFVRIMQPQFQAKYFEDKEKYPLLTEIFQKACEDIELLNVDMKKPLAFSVLHFYADSAKNARKTKMRIEHSPEEFLKERGLL